MESHPGHDSPVALHLNYDTLSNPIYAVYTSVLDRRSILKDALPRRLSVLLFVLLQEGLSAAEELKFGVKSVDDAYDLDVLDPSGVGDEAGNVNVLQLEERHVGGVLQQLLPSQTPHQVSRSMNE